MQHPSALPELGALALVVLARALVRDEVADSLDQARAAVLHSCEVGAEALLQGDGDVGLREALVDVAALAVLLY